MTRFVIKINRILITSIYAGWLLKIKSYMKFKDINTVDQQAFKYDFFFNKPYQAYFQ